MTGVVEKTSRCPTRSLSKAQAMQILMRAKIRSIPLWSVLTPPWRTLLADWLVPYRPELHYMRGPGPKWREKHAHASRAMV